MLFSMHFTLEGRGRRRYGHVRNPTLDTSHERVRILVMACNKPVAGKEDGETAEIRTTPSFDAFIFYEALPRYYNAYATIAGIINDTNVRFWAKPPASAAANISQSRAFSRFIMYNDRGLHS